MSDTKRKIILKKLSALNTIWHPETTLVFKSQNDRLVIGRYVNCEVIPLDEEAMLLCNEWNFKPDPTIIPDEGDEGEEESEGEGVLDKDEGDEGGPDNCVSNPDISVPLSVPLSVPISVPQRCESGADMVQRLTSAMVVELVDIVNSREEALVSKTKEMDDLQARYTELETLHNAMEKKFSAMKSLFT